jgi:nucleoid-associated protein YgaU
MKSMKVLLVLIVLLFVAPAVFAQSLQDNPDYQAALQLQKSAEEAYANGDYDNANNYSAQAEELFNKVLAASDKDALKAQADSLLKLLDERMAKVDAKRAGKEFPDQLNNAKTRQGAAKDAYAAEDYQQSINEAQAALAALDELDALLAQGATTTGPAEGEIVLPRYYVVRLIPGNRDCLWNIAKYPFVFNDPTKWKLLYNANKKKLVVPANPDLILPKQILEIPSIAGEKREGTYDPTQTYPALPNK